MDIKYGYYVLTITSSYIIELKEWPFNTGRGLGKFGLQLKKYYNPSFACMKKIQLLTQACKKNIHPPLELIFYIPKFNCFYIKTAVL